MLTSLIQNDLVLLAFIIAIPLVIVAAVVVGFFAVGALFDALDDPEALQGRIEAFFRKPPAEARATDAKHYYRPYWAR
jgi:hypothetical protein